MNNEPNNQDFEALLRELRELCRKNDLRTGDREPSPIEDTLVKSTLVKP